MIAIDKAQVEKPTIPMDYKWAKDLGLVRKPSEFVSTICDDRKEVRTPPVMTDDIINESWPRDSHA